MSNTTTTIYGAAVQTALLRKLPLEYLPNTTLNQKFDIYPDARPSDNEFPHLQYFAIGRGGHRNITGSDGAPLNQLNWHVPSNSALYKQLPFVLRPIDLDLSSEQRTDYALRRKEIHDSKEYYAYYLKRLPVVIESPKLLLTTVKDGEPTTIPYIPTSSDLNPVPPELSPEGDMIISGQYLSTTSPLVITLNDFDIAEIINACEIIHSNRAYAVISEVALISALNRSVTTETNGSDINFNEAIVSQCNIIQCTGPYDLNSVNNRLDFSYELGASEMLAL